MTTYDNEATRYQDADNEATQFENNAAALNNTTDNAAAPAADGTKAKSTNSRTWKSAAVGAGTGLLVGSLATVLMGMKSPDEADTDGSNADDKPASGDNRDQLSHPDWVDDKVPVAVDVNDDMTFGQAFQAARAEVGAGGCFEWHGNLYSTYTAEEWNNMSAEERAEWGDHFSWNKIDHTQSDVAQHSNTAHQQPAPEQPADNDDDIEIISVDQNGSNDIAQNENQNSVEAEVAADTEPEVEILGVVHDDTTGANIGGMSVGGEDVILIDVDNDMTFDYMASDINSNGQIDAEELVDIQGQNVTVNDLGGMTDNSDMLAGSDNVDYSNDSVYEG